MSKKKIFLWLIFILFFVITPVCYGESEYSVLLEDDADLLTQSEEELLLADMEKLTEYGNIAFKTISVNKYYSTATFASNYYHQNFGQESGTVFVIDMDLREVYIFSDGKNYKTITRFKALSITDNVYRYATNEQYYDCAKEVFSQVYQLLEGGKIAEPMKYTSNLLIAIMISVMINFGIFKKITAIREMNVKDVLKESHQMIQYHEFNIIPTGSYKVYSPLSSDSSGGGGSSSSSGGRRQ